MIHGIPETSDFLSTLDVNRVPEEKLKTELLQSEVVDGTLVSTRSRRPFRTTLLGELRRLAEFVKIQQEGLEQTAKTLFLRADALATDETIVPESQTTLSYLQRSTRKAVEDCLALQAFYTLGCNILSEIAVKADQRLPSPTYEFAPLLHEGLPKAHLNSSLVCVVSDIYHALRQAHEKILHHGNAGGETLWEAPSSFQRSTTKYWVKDENLTKLMMTCAAEAPLLVYGMKGPLTSKESSTLNLSDGDKLWDSLATRITSIYFDSDDMSLYKERLARAQGAKLLRVRWYGNTMPTGDKIMFVELKTHHEKWVGNKSVKERALIQERDMLEFLSPVPWKSHNAREMILRAKPKMKPEDLANAIDLLLRMHNLVVKHKLTACVRSVYDRAAFQSAKSNDLRLTLDRNVTVVNERVQQFSEGQWCLTDSEAQTARSCVVPFNVFEVKLAKDGAMPTGLAEAQDDSTMILAVKFSKFLTGAAAFNAVPTLPYWAAHPAFYSFFQLDRRGLPSRSSSSNDALQGEYNLMGSSNETDSSILPEGVAIAPKYPARIEPKTYFANERTFVQWISASILLLSVSAFLLRAGDHFKTTAAVISLLALCLVVYSTYLYFARLKLLRDREPYGYFNKVNPIFLTSVVGVVIFLIWADSVTGDDIFSVGKEIFSFTGKEEKDRRLRRSLPPVQVLRQEYEECSQEVIRTNTIINESISSFVVDFNRHSFLMTSNESVYIQPMNDDGTVPAKVEPLIRINDVHLQGLAIVGDRLFAVSGGPARTELIEMAWWSAPKGNERLRVVGRWTLQDNRSQVDGFSLVPYSDSIPVGRFYIKMNSSILVYSVPARGDNEERGDPSRPMKLKSLNTKVLTQGTQANVDRLATMVTFEGITYILRSDAQVLQAWNLTEGTRFSDIKLPSSDADNIMKWTGFALERKMETESPNVRGGDMLSKLASDVLFLHLMNDQAAVGPQIWSLPVVEHVETPGGSISVPDCRIATTSM